jgi:hypothetical protein
MSSLSKDVTSGFMDQPCGTSPHGWLRYYALQKICDTRASVRQRSGGFPSHLVGRSNRYGGQVNPRLGSDILSTKLVQLFRYPDICIYLERHQYLNRQPCQRHCDIMRKYRRCNLRSVRFGITPLASETPPRGLQLAVTPALDCV